MKTLLTILILSALSFADSITPDVWGYRGATYDGGQFFQLEGLHSLSYLGVHPFVATLPSGYTSGSMVWTLTVGGQTYVQTITATTAAGFSAFLPLDGGACPSVTTANAFVSSMCASAAFSLPLIQNALPAHLNITFLDADGHLVTSLDRDFTIATVPEPASILLFGSGMLSIVGLLKRKYR